MASFKKSTNWTMCRTPSDSSSVLPPAICQKEISITYVESPCLFWGTLVSQLDKQLDIENRLSSLCDTLPRLKTAPKSGKVYACKFSLDGVWYRCKVYQFVNKNQTEVLYIDYGNREVVENSSLVDLPPDLADVHVLAYPYWVIKCKNVNSDDVIEKGVDFMEDLKTSTSLKALLYSKTRDCLIPVTATIGSGEDLGELLVARKFCVFMSDEELKEKFTSSSHIGSDKTNISEKHSPSIRNPLNGRTAAGGGGGAASLSSSTTAPMTAMSSTGGYNKERKHSATTSSSSPIKASRNAASSPLVDSASKSPSSSVVGTKMMPRSKSRSPVKLLKLKSKDDQSETSEAHSLQQKNDAGDDGDGKSFSQHLNKKNIEFGIEQLSCELTESTNDVLCLQLENSNLKQEIEDFKNQIVTLEEIANNKSVLTSSKLKSLVIEAKRITKLKKKQVKQNELKFELDKMGDILLSLQPSNPMLRKIASVRAVFDNLQKKIKAKATSDEELIKLISARDSARKLLYGDLEEFLIKSAQYPLDESFNKIKELLTELGVKNEKLKELERMDKSMVNDCAGEEESTYGDLPEDKFQNALLSYRAWRMTGIKDVRFFEMRIEEKRLHITQVLTYVIKVINEDEMNDQKDETIFNNFDDIINEFMDVAKEGSLSILKELGEIDEGCKVFSGQLEGTGDEKSSAAAMTTLWTSIEGLLIEVKKVIEIIYKYRGLMYELGLWLEKVPDVADLRNVMKAVRFHKSNLRHLLADQADYEEEKTLKGQSSDESHKLNLLAKLNQTRCLLQDRLELEDQIVINMVESDLRQFPELIVYHPDIPFESFLNFTSLVKHGRSLDQYSLEPFGKEENTYKSTYLGRTVALKEYYLHGKSFEQFESMVNEYLSCDENRAISRIDFIFFDFKKLTAIIQSRFREHNLSRMLTTGSDEKMLLYMMYNVLVDLDKLHQKGIVHASLNPSYVLYDSNQWMAFIRPYDFSVSTYERAKNNFWRNWRYAAPEVLQGCKQINPSVDMFSFGVLLYQIYRPSQPLDKFSDISTLLGSEPQSSRIEIIKQLLNMKPEQRPTAGDLLKSQYWLDVARDYEKGKLFLCKQTVSPEEKTAATLLAEMCVKSADRKQLLDRRYKHRASDSNLLMQDSENCTLGEDRSDYDESTTSEEKYVREKPQKKKSSKVKFRVEDEEIEGDGGEEDDDDDDEDDDDELTQEDLESGMSSEKHAKGSSGKRPGPRKIRNRHERETTDDASSDANTDDSTSFDQDAGQAVESGSGTSTISAETTMIKIGKKVPSFEERISGVNRLTESPNKRAFKHDSFVDAETPDDL